MVNIKVHYKHNKEFLNKMFQYMIDNNIGIMEFEHKNNINVGLYVSYRLENIKEYNSDEYSFTLYVNKDFKGHSLDYKSLVNKLEEIEEFQIINYKEDVKLKL